MAWGLRLLGRHKTVLLAMPFTMGAAGALLAYAGLWNVAWGSYQAQSLHVSGLFLPPLYGALGLLAWSGLCRTGLHLRALLGKTAASLVVVA